MSPLSISLDPPALNAPTLSAPPTPLSRAQARKVKRTSVTSTSRKSQKDPSAIGKAYVDALDSLLRTFELSIEYHAYCTRRMQRESALAPQDDLDSSGCVSAESATAMESDTQSTASYSSSETEVEGDYENGSSDSDSLSPTASVSHSGRSTSSSSSASISDGPPTPPALPDKPASQIGAFLRPPLIIVTEAASLPGSPSPTGKLNYAAAARTAVPQRRTRPVFVPARPTARQYSEEWPVLVRPSEVLKRRMGRMAKSGSLDEIVCQVTL